MSTIHDFYKVLKINRNATQNEIKEAYRKMAMALHPDRHKGCELKGDQFKEATEAYKVLSDKSKRKAHDELLNGYSKTSSNSFSGPIPNYRKVYAPQPPPGFKIFDAKKHYDMHYGDGMMKEEIERARKRAEKASGRQGSGYEYESPLGRGFDFQEGMGENPFRSKRRDNKQHYSSPNKFRNIEEQFEYEEGYIDVGSSNYSTSKRIVRGREVITERMQQRRKLRSRNRGDPIGNQSNNDESCIIT